MPLLYCQSLFWWFVVLKTFRINVTESDIITKKVTGESECFNKASRGANPVLVGL